MPSFGLTEIVEHIGYLPIPIALTERPHDVSLERVLCVASFVRNGYRFTPDGQRFESLRADLRGNQLAVDLVCYVG